ncbi:hypothetical protein JUJ52_02780 [Virgibacillus sp. AGTR]|uniref:hypothetical protein n=1 Tax=Virgibacillus sp. AGTR TaxID=2812055 RepID=UPI001D16B4BF|nr:hypothetical protein [Virgibacillus sp. AGTR]MCC2248882.1 hypothetical protein [Virgibacillus sp. AGTR]
MERIDILSDQYDKALFQIARYRQAIQKALNELSWSEVDQALERAGEILKDILDGGYDI